MSSIDAGASPSLRRPTIHDVARRAGVTVGTASKALNGRGALREETRERVRVAAREIDFRPNELMRSLQRGRTFTVGFVTEDPEERFTMPLLSGIDTALGEARVLVYFARLTGEPEQERQVIDALLSKRIEGLIYSRTRIDAGPPVDVGSYPTPIVYVDTLVTDPDALSVIPDDAQGGGLAVQHLVDNGRSRIAHLTGPADWLSTQLRVDAMRQVLNISELPFAEHRLVYGDWTEPFGYDAIARLVDRDPEIDGLFAGNDRIARGAIDRLVRLGVRVPEDVAVVGFDNVRMVVEQAHPPITSVDMNLAEVGRIAVQHLLAIIAGERRSGVIRVPCSLVLRESSVVHP